MLFRLTMKPVLSSNFKNRYCAGNHWSAKAAWLPIERKAKTMTI